MSNEFQITKDVALLEQSCLLQFAIDLPDCSILSKEFTPEQLRIAIIKQIEVLSYFSDDPEEVLKRFNVKYGDVK